MQRQQSSSAIARLFPEAEAAAAAADVEAKPEKAPSAKSRSVHLIPLLTVLCFVVLFILSHHPSASDMASFGGKVESRKARLF